MLCVCVCERERERERNHAAFLKQTSKPLKMHQLMTILLLIRTSSQPVFLSSACQCHLTRPSQCWKTLVWCQPVGSDRLATATRLSLSAQCSLCCSFRLLSRGASCSFACLSEALLCRAPGEGRLFDDPFSWVLTKGVILIVPLPAC